MSGRKLLVQQSFVAGAYHWLALDDSQSFTPVDGLPEGPHLARIECVEGEWFAYLCGRHGGTLELGSNPDHRIVWASWEKSALWGRAFHGQQLRVTWLGEVHQPKMPAAVDPI